jgi:hypothetical protein
MFELTLTNGHARVSQVTRSGLPASPNVGVWLEVNDTVWNPQQAHMDESYAAYLRRYL